MQEGAIRWAAYICPPGPEILLARESLDHGLEQLADLPRAEFRDGNRQLAGGILFAEDARGDGIFDGGARYRYRARSGVVRPGPSGLHHDRT